MHNEGNYKQGERRPSEWEKIIASETTDKGLIFKIYKQFIQLNTRKKRQPNETVGKRLKKTFLQKDIQMANRCMKTLNIIHY